MAGNDDELHKTSSRCRLLELPAELRLHIYELVLTEQSPIDVELTNYRGFYPARAPVQPPLARSCRTVRQEALPIFYGATIGRLYLEKEEFAGTSSIANFTSSKIRPTLRPYIPCMKRIEICYGHLGEGYDIYTVEFATEVVTAFYDDRLTDDPNDYAFPVVDLRPLTAARRHRSCKPGTTGGG